MKVDFQIIHSFKPKKLKENLLSLLKETIKESTTIQIEIEEEPEIIENWSIFDWIEVKYNIHSDDKYIAGFSLDTECEVENFKKLTKEFGQKLQSNSGISLVIKYNDEAMMTNYQNYVKEIFELEMKLREAISFIFLDTYKEDYYNLLKDVNVKTQPISQNSQPDENYFKSHFENEFFFLLFSDYTKLDNQKDLEQHDLIDMISDSDSYEDLKQKIQNRGICKKKYQDFLAEIQRNLDPIEKVRNCIAHNRSIERSNDNRMIVDYENSIDRLKKSIDDFWVNIKNDQTEER